MRCSLSKLLEFVDFCRRILQDPNDLFAGYSLGDKKMRKLQIDWESRGVF